MCLLMLEVFIDASKVGVLPQIFLLTVYAYILYRASEFLSSGSEKLLSLYSAGIIGGCVIPVLGALPDSAIILFSGLGGGSRTDIERNMAVGVGTLAGSTIMLLSVPLALSIYYGRRDAHPTTGLADAELVDGVKRPKCSSIDFKFTLTQVVTVFPSVPKQAKIMMFTSLSYFIIQVPAFFFSHDSDKGVSHEHWFSLLGLVSTLVLFVGYGIYQLQNAADDELVQAAQREATKRRFKAQLRSQLGEAMDEGIQTVFRRHDVDGNQHLDRSELTAALKDLGFAATRQEVNAILAEMDGAIDGQDCDELVSLEEFSFVIRSWMQRSRVHVNHSHDDLRIEEEEAPLILKVNPNAHPTFQPIQQERLALTANEMADVEEEEDAATSALSDTELFHLALWELLLGAALVAVFSDPMVDVLGNMGKKMGVSPFYLSFFVTPLVSNASEMISALHFAKKKTNKGVSLAVSALYGAATMNNTLGLATFMGLIFFRQLTWTYSAEVIGTLLVTYIVGWIGLSATYTVRQAFVVFSLLPLSVGLIALLNHMGLQ